MWLTSCTIKSRGVSFNQHSPSAHLRFVCNIRPSIGRIIQNWMVTWGHFICVTTSILVQYPAHLHVAWTLPCHQYYRVFNAHAFGIWFMQKPPNIFIFLHNNCCSSIWRSFIIFITCLLALVRQLWMSSPMIPNFTWESWVLQVYPPLVMIIWPACSDRCSFIFILQSKQIELGPPLLMHW